MDRDQHAHQEHQVQGPVQLEAHAGQYVAHDEAEQHDQYDRYAGGAQAVPHGLPQVIVLVGEDLDVVHRVPDLRKADDVGVEGALLLEGGIEHPDQREDAAEGEDPKHQVDQHRADGLAHRGGLAHGGHFALLHGSHLHSAGGPLDQPLAAADDGQGQHEYRHGDGAAVAQVGLLEGDLVAVHGHHHRGITRSAGGHGVDVVEGLHVAGDAQRQADQQRIADQGQRDVHGGLEAGGAIDLGGFEDGFVDAGDSGEHDDHVIADVLPDQRNGHVQHDVLGIVQPDLGPLGTAQHIDDEPVQYAVLVVIHHAPDHADADGGDGAGEEAEGAVDGLALGQAGIGEQHQYERDADLADDAGRHQIEVVAEGRPEHLVREQLLIVGNAVEYLVGAALPLEEAVHQRGDQREEHGEYKQGNRDQQVQIDG